MTSKNPYADVSGMHLEELLGARLEPRPCPEVEKLKASHAGQAWFSFGACFLVAIFLGYDPRIAACAGVNTLLVRGQGGVVGNEVPLPTISLAFSLYLQRRSTFSNVHISITIT